MKVYLLREAFKIEKIKKVLNFFTLWVLTPPPIEVKYHIIIKNFFAFLNEIGHQ